MDSLVPIENGRKHHFVSIDFHEFQIDGIITPTRKILSVKHKSPHAFLYLTLMLYLKNVPCGSDYAINLMLVRVD